MTTMVLTKPRLTSPTHTSLANQGFPRGDVSQQHGVDTITVMRPLEASLPPPD